MANLRDLRRRRKSVANTKKITKTMELVASAKMKKAQAAAAASRPYSEALYALVRDLVAAGADVDIQLLAKRPVKSVTIYVCTSDRGLAGAFNANLVALALERAEEHRKLGRQVRFIALSKKAGSSLAFAGFPAAQTFSGIMDSPKYARARTIAEEATRDFLAGTSDLTEVVYSRFVSASRQNPDHVALLPVGAVAEVERKPGKVDYLYHPGPAELLAAIVPQLVKTMLFSALLQTSSGEHAARRVAMKNATDAASDMGKALATAYNRGRQGKITQEIAEIVGAVEAMA